MAPQLADALQKVGPEERVYFELFAPGMNPQYRRDVTGGWVAVHDQLLHLTIDYFHVQQPVRKSDPYDYNYPTPWTPRKDLPPVFRAGSILCDRPQDRPARSGLSGVPENSLVALIAYSHQHPFSDVHS